MGKIIVVNNLMQIDYSYELTHDRGDLSDLESKYDFHPDLTPIQMLEYGIMGGKYFSDVVDDNEYPKDILRVISKVSVGVLAHKDPKRNKFKINASSSLKSWRDNGWITDQDPRGWIEWYLRTSLLKIVRIFRMELRLILNVSL